MDIVVNFFVDFLIAPVVVFCWGRLESNFDRNGTMAENDDNAESRTREEEEKEEIITGTFPTEESTAFIPTGGGRSPTATTGLRYYS